MIFFVAGSRAFPKYIPLRVTICGDARISQNMTWDLHSGEQEMIIGFWMECLCVLVKYGGSRQKWKMMQTNFLVILCLCSDWDRDSYYTYNRLEDFRVQIRCKHV